MLHHLRTVDELFASLTDMMKQRKLKLDAQLRVHSFLKGTFDFVSRPKGFLSIHKIQDIQVADVKKRRISLLLLVSSSFRNSSGISTTLSSPNIFQD